MSKHTADEDLRLWERLVESHLAFVSASTEFINGDVDRVPIMKRALRDRTRATALYLAPYLSAADKQALFPEWLFLASFDHGALHLVREIILSLPREWVLNNIESVTAELLKDAEPLDYRRFLELYSLLDRNLALRLAERARNHSDEEVAEAGEEFVEKLTKSLE